MQTRGLAAVLQAKPVGQSSLLPQNTVQRFAPALTMRQAPSWIAATPQSASPAMSRVMQLVLLKPACASHVLTRSAQTIAPVPSTLVVVVART